MEFEIVSTFLSNQLEQTSHLTLLLDKQTSTLPLSLCNGYFYRIRTRLVKQEVVTENVRYLC